jgi:hypothetical protein
VAQVSRFYFHIYDEIVVRDDEGLDLPDVAGARATALAGARALMCDQLKDGRLNLDHRIEVEDEAGKPVLTLLFADAIEIRP